MKYDLSVIVPGVRTHNWVTLCHHIGHACSRNHEIIYCGPNPLPDELQPAHNIKYIKELGSPSRSLQISSLFTEGKLMTWIVDDAHLYPGSIDAAIDLLFAHDPEKDIIGLRYCEGIGHSGNEHTHPANYSNVSTHKDLQAPKVDLNWLAPGVQLMSSAYWKWLGGIDCSYEHINMNLYDFAYRAQRNGSRVIMTPGLVVNCDFEVALRTVENSAVIDAFWNNDRELYQKMYAADAPDRPIQIDLNNWRKADAVWGRRK